MKRSPDDPLEAALRRDATRLVPASPPPGMERRIAAIIAQNDPVLRRPSGFRSFGWPLLAGLAVLGAFVFVSQLPLPTARSPGVASDPALDRAEVAQLAQSVKTMPAQVWNSVRPGATALLQDDPLRQEATDLYSDARSALGFLAVNFIPGAQPAGHGRG